MTQRLVLEILLVVLLAGTVAMAASLMAGRTQRTALARRIDALRGRDDSTQHSVEAITLRRTEPKTSWRSRLDRLFAIDRSLVNSPGIAVWQVALVAVPAGAAAFWLVASFIGLPWPVGVPAGAAAVVMAGRWCYTRVRRKALARLLDQFPDALGLVVRAIRSGIPVAESIRALGDSMHAPSGPEFRRVADEIAVGVDLETALWRLSERSGLAEYRFFVVAVVLQRETGGDLSETLDLLADVIRKRRAIRQRGFALSAEARMSVWVLSALPFVAMGALYLLNPAYVLRLFTTLEGKILLGTAAVSLTLGILTMKAMIRKMLA